MTAEQLKKILDITGDMKLVRYNREITEIELSEDSNGTVINVKPGAEDNRKSLPIVTMVYPLLEIYPNAKIKTWNEDAKSVEIDFANKTVDIKS